MGLTFFASKSKYPEKARWGLWAIVCAVLAVSVVLWMSFQLTPVSNPGFYSSFLPKTGIVFSLLAIIVGHLSYPRISNLKIYLLGYTTGLSGILIFVFHLPIFSDSVQRPNSGFIHLIYLFVLVNHCLVAILPPFIKFRWTRRITYMTLAVQIVLAYIIGFQADVLPILVHLRTWHQPIHSAIPAFLCVLILSHLFIGRDFYLAGILSGSMLFISTAWSAPVLFENPARIQTILFSAWALYVCLGVLLHWFSRIEHRVAYDGLTQLYNRSHCDKILAEQTSVNTALPICIAMVDIDHFKKVNDTYGHQAGDDILANTSAVIKKQVMPRGIVCRYGGEEIVVFLAGQDLERASQVLEKVRIAVKKSKVPVKRRQVSVTVSIGVAERRALSVPLSDVMAAADKSLYMAKKGGRDQVRAGRKQIGPSKKTVRKKSIKKSATKKAGTTPSKRARKKPQPS